jgi:hypothetical protein
MLLATQTEPNNNSPATPLRPSLDLETVLVEKIWKREVLEFGTGAVIDFDSPWVECPYLAHLWI